MLGCSVFSYVRDHWQALKPFGRAGTAPCFACLCKGTTVVGALGAATNKKEKG